MELLFVCTNGKRSRFCLHLWHLYSKYEYDPNSGDQRDCHDHKQDHFLKVKEQELSVTLQSWRYYLLILVSVIVAIFVSINYLFGV